MGGPDQGELFFGRLWPVDVDLALSGGRTVHGTSPPAHFQLFVVGDEKTQTLYVTATTQIGVLVRRSGHELDASWLTWGGRPLKPTRTVGEYGLHTGATLYLCGRGQGGAPRMSFFSKGPSRLPDELVALAEAKEDVEQDGWRLASLLDSAGATAIVADAMVGKGPLSP